ncbi:MAG TPA: SOS response-associated peptidase [Candidatus Limnocylindrales bacterium]|nr:SOS response-associated peptidase [Candidatus Limnocylindrales bacterium]
MCGRFTQERSTSELAEIFGATDLADDPGGRYNVAPTDEAAVVVQRDERRAIVRYRWGLVPHWSDDARGAARRINARAETVGSSPAFRESFAQRRCLVPVDSFYEWRREGAVRQPYRVVRTDGRPLALAGLWSGWRDPADGVVRRTFTIVTSAPNLLVSTLHDRMPVVVPDDAWERWLDPSARDLGELHGLLAPDDGLPLEIHAVPRLVNDVRRDGPELIERLPA